MTKTCNYYYYSVINVSLVVYLRLVVHEVIVCLNGRHEQY